MGRNGSRRGMFSLPRGSHLRCHARSAKYILCCWLYLTSCAAQHIACMHACIYQVVSLPLPPVVPDYEVRPCSAGLASAGRTIARLLLGVVEGWTRARVDMRVSSDPRADERPQGTAGYSGRGLVKYTCMAGPSHNIFPRLLGLSEIVAKSCMRAMLSDLRCAVMLLCHRLWRVGV